jgi:glucose-6-phosphate isomerase
MRIKEDYEGQINALDQEKVKLIKRLNEAILELDKINQEKGELNDKLISLF